MNSFQRTIKYIAIGFAVFLAVIIIAGIVNLAFGIISAVSGGVKYYDEKAVDFKETFTDVRSLDINNSTGRLIIKTGNEFRVEAEKVTDDFVAEVKSDGTLVISDDENGFDFLWFNFSGFNHPNSKILLYLPADFVADEALIDSGAGSVTIDGLHTEYLEISAGAGSISGNDMTAEEAKLDGGVGSISLDDVNFTDADFNCGVGSLNIEGILLGETKVDCGVGGVSLNLEGDVDDYDFDVDSGVGDIRLNGKKISNEYDKDNNSPNSIKIDGGVGGVNINIR